MKLYGYWRSSCSWRVRIALNLKGIQYETIPVHLVKGGGEQHAAEYRAKNPMGQVPFLELSQSEQLPSGVTLSGLSQSIAIISYLDEVYPAPPLLGEGALTRARVRWLSELITSGVQPLQNLSVLKELERRGVDPADWARQVMGRGLAALEETVRGETSTFLVGEAPTLADVCLVPQLYNARRYELDLGAYPRLLEVERACAALPAFDAARPELQPDAVSAG
ncbi:MAG: maleylacetoacetate isomerase [Polyangiaceae bacterium]|nr:maleylacetoacetate isomerase [Polyangiaceae bacterium]MCW5789795.1 maleylacetoacetate isomerase [Polyangiaceae bacterium]